MKHTCINGKNKKKILILGISRWYTSFNFPIKNTLTVLRVLLGFSLQYRKSDKSWTNSLCASNDMLISPYKSPWFKDELCSSTVRKIESSKSKSLSWLWTNLLPWWLPSALDSVTERVWVINFWIVSDWKHVTTNFYCAKKLMEAAPCISSLKQLFSKFKH